MAQDNGLVKRGLFLLVLMSGLVIVVLAILFQRADTKLPAAMPRPELLTSTLVQTDTAFPANVTWLGVQQIGEAFPSGPGWRIRYNAAAALARRGSPSVPWAILIEMLDEDRQMHNFRELRGDGRAVPNEAAALTTVLAALKATAEWHKKRANNRPEVSPELQKLYAAVDKLTASPIMEIKLQAENTRKVFFR